jgi:CBS domain containing-hemolysin-like protein
VIELLGVVALALAISGLCSLLEAVLLSVPASHVALMRERSRSGELLWEMRRDLDEPVAAILTLNTISHTVGAAVAGALALQLWGSGAMALFSALLTLAILVLSEILPKTLGARYSRQLAGFTTRVLIVLRWLLRPILIPLAWVNRLLSGAGSGAPTVSRAELEVLAEIGRQEGTIDPDESHIVTRTMALHRLRVEQVMVPRNGIDAVRATATLQEVRDAVFRRGHTRLPVYGQDLDDIVGVVWAGDLGGDGTADSAKDIARAALYLPGSLAADDAIELLRAEAAKLAIVVDEYGGTDGLVTMEDLVEEIVGDIADERGMQPVVDAREDGSLVVRGIARVSDVEQALEVDVHAPVGETVAGFLMRRLARIPRGGDTVRENGLLWTVSDVRGPRVHRVEVRKASP